MAVEPSGPYVYPLLDQDRYKARIQFQAIKVEPPQFSEDLRFAANEVFSAIGDAATLQRDNPEASSQSIGSRLREQSGKNKNLKKMKLLPIAGEKASIYMPISLAFDDRLQYNTPSLDTMGGALLGGINQGSGIMASAAEAIERGFASITDLFNGVPTEMAGLAAVRASKAVPFVPESVRNALSVAARVSLNPNTVAAFGSVGLRTFTFQFSFIAKSADEAEEVKKIIYFFRKRAYPERFGGLVAYKFPDMFRIKLLYNTGDTFKVVGTNILDCYLQTITTNYNPSQMAFHPDGEPVEVSLSLNFIEHRTLSRSDVTFDPKPFETSAAEFDQGGDFIT